MKLLHPATASGGNVYARSGVSSAALAANVFAGSIGSAGARNAPADAVAIMAWQEVTRTSADPLKVLLQWTFIVALMSFALGVRCVGAVSYTHLRAHETEADL
eukprot:3197675-Amphidinium_carterae.1